MDTFTTPVGQADSISHLAQEQTGQDGPRRPKAWPFAWLNALLLKSEQPLVDNNRSFPLALLAKDSGPGGGLAVPPQGNAANIIPHEFMPARRMPRLWNPGLRCAPNAFGNASGGVKYADSPGMLVYLPVGPAGNQKQSVLMKLNIFRQAPIRAVAGQANAKPAAGGSGSAESVRIPSVSTLGAF